MKTLKKSAITAVAALCAVFGGATALASKTHRGKHRSDAGHFAILARPAAHTASAQQAGLPSNAVLAATVGDNEVYAFERTAGLQAEICVADQVTTTIATACSRSGVAEREGVDLILPNLGTAPAIVVLVPNGVKAVSFMRAGSNTPVIVANNVAVAEGAITAYHYDMPSGNQQAVAIQNG